MTSTTPALHRCLPATGRILATIAAAICLFQVSGPAAAQFLGFRNVLERAGRPQADLRINYGPGEQQFGELWLPRGKPGPHPVVLMIHGGCWRADLPGPELLAWQADALRNEGLAVWSITYRRLGHEGGGYPGSFQDVAAGADHLKKLAASFKLDLQRVVTTGHSAGGHFALWLAARRNIPAGSALKSAEPLAVHAAVPVAGVGDLAYGATFTGAACGADTVANLVDQKGRGADAWRDTSPAALLPLGIPQVMVSGLYDPIVAPAQARRWQMLASKQGDRVTLRTLDESGHFEIISPWTPAGSAVVKAIVEVVQGLADSR